MSDEREQQYGGITDPDALAWLRRNYPPKPTEEAGSQTSDTREKVYGPQNRNTENAFEA